MIVNEDNLMKTMDQKSLKRILEDVMKRLNKDKVDLDVKLAFSQALLRGNING